MGPSEEQVQHLFDKLVEAIGRDATRTLFELLHRDPDRYDGHHSSHQGP